MEPITVEVITEVLGNLVFPIAAFGLIFWMLNTTVADLQSAISDLRSMVEQSNNTMIRLIDKLDVDVK